MSAPFTSHDLQRFIANREIEATIMPMAGHTPTVSDAARELGVATESIIKSLVFLSDGAPLLVINNGLARVDRRKLAAILGVGRKKVKFATAEQALAITGFVVGSMPPFGHRQVLRTLVDPAVLAMETIYGGGGDINAMMRLTSRELMRATGAEVQALSEA
jgi:prolyl-tRNA editing enzyme YbaK/EbsC (Cys-tRNA(Pro) deacylase)